MPKIETSGFPYILGIDLGANSIGWSVIEHKGKQPIRIVDAGVRCFEAGVEGDIQGGRDSSRAANRRMKRQPRRQFWRRSRRKEKLFRLLQRAGMLPNAPVSTAETRHNFLLELDAELRPSFLKANCRVDAHLLPYKIRAAAVESEVPLHAFGRALLHLNQRRGFKSGLKVARKDDEEEGKVKSAISELANELQDRTLGQFFAGLDPEMRRIRQRWTSRQMYLDEFERMWATQATHHLSLTPELKKVVFKTIFFQRPLKSQKGLVGWCDIETNRRRCPLALPIAQRFRLLQKVNDLTVIDGTSLPRRLTADERTKLLQALDNAASLGFPKIRKLLGVPKNSRFNFEEGGEKGLVGNKTNTIFLEAFGNRWLGFAPDEQERIIQQVVNYRKPERFHMRAQRAWGLTKDQSEALYSRVEDGYARHSKEALTRLVEAMEQGLHYSEAKAGLYPQTVGQAVDELPPVREAFRQITNPAVIRALTELRKVVNAVIRKHGKPDTISIELARDLRRSRDERQQMTRNNRERERQRKAALKRILEELPGYAPKAGSDPNVERVLLAEECNWRCPYTDKPIEMRTLIGEHSQFDVEHIYPRRFLDNSFANKTLCFHEENRTRKGNKLPWEAYANDPERWEHMLTRVRAFKGNWAREKLRRFLTEEVGEEFTSRQLNDTRYNSRLASDYLGLLFGGRSDANGQQRIFTITGGLTALIRSQWKLNGILGDGRDKGRADHRHHAVDALVIAMSSRSLVQELQNVIGSDRTKILPKLNPPWAEFLEDARKAILGIVVSHRVNRKLSGPLHDETIYGHPRDNGKAGQSQSVVSKELRSLSSSEIEKIVDPATRRLVQEKLRELGGSPDKAFQETANHPVRIGRDGRSVPVHKVKISKSGSFVAIGGRNGSTNNGNVRYILPGANHGTFIVSNADGTRWKDIPITRLEAVRQVTDRKNLNAVQLAPPTLPEGWSVNFHLMMNDCIEGEDQDGRRQFYRIMNASEGDIQLQLHSDARDAKTLRQEAARVRVSGEKLRKMKARKVDVGPAGDVHYVATKCP